MHFGRTLTLLFVASAMMMHGNTATAQSVCLPAPRLETIMPMGGQVGTTVEVKVAGESLDTDYDLLFSDPHVTATPIKTADGEIVPGKFKVTIAKDAKPGVCDARVMTRLGVSAARVFSIGSVPEIVREKPNTTLKTALKLTPNVICNAYTTKKAIDYYQFETRKGARTVVECAAVGLDSRLTPVLIVADAKGRDLKADRHGGLIDFTAPADGTYVIKVHGLTYEGGTEHFYRLALTSLPASAPIQQQARTLAVNSITIPPAGNSGTAPIEEIETPQKKGAAQKVTLPCEVHGKFFPAADVDSFEFSAKKGETWWVEVVSERLGLPTNPFVVVQRITREGGQEQFADVAELNDIASPVKLSTNGYSYNGVFYDTGSADPMGKIEIKEDGDYRLQLRDLFGGTTSDPRNEYRLIIRKATPDFSLATWALHMNLRNGDRNVLSKPIALRNGAAMVFDVVTVRKDGFNGPIKIVVEGLPEGVTAGALTIPAGKSAGTLVISAAEDAPRAMSIAKITGHAQINGTEQTRPCHLASVAWATKNANRDVPAPRLMADIPVSVSGHEFAPLTIVPAEDKVWLALPGDKLTIPLKLTWRGDFSGALKLKVVGAGFEKATPLDVPLNSPNMELVLDLAALKTPPGDYDIALDGAVVSNYRYNVAAVTAAEADVKAAEELVKSTTTAVQKATEEAKTATAESKAATETALKEATEKQKQAQAAKVAADQKLKRATQIAKPKDIVDIVVSAPIHIRVQPADSK